MGECYLSNQGESGAKLEMGSYTALRNKIDTIISLGWVPDSIFFSVDNGYENNIWWFYDGANIGTSSQDQGFINSSQIASLTSDGFKVHSSGGAAYGFLVNYIAVKF